MSLFMNGLAAGGGRHAPGSGCKTVFPGARVIMPLGDSITYGFNSVSSIGGYRPHLFQRAAAAGKPMEFVGGGIPNGPDSYLGWVFPTAHQGTIGYTIANVASIVNAALSTYAPTIALLHIGTNDMSGDPNAAATSLGALLDQMNAASPSLSIYVAKIVPRTDAATDAITQTYNAGVATQVGTRGSFCTLVDMTAAFKANANWATDYYAVGDPIHPNDLGYAVMGAAWHTAID